MEPYLRSFWGVILEVILGLWDGAGVVSVGDGGVWCRWEREREDVVGDSERGWVGGGYIAMCGHT